MSLAFFKSPRQIIFIHFGLEYKKSKDQMLHLYCRTDYASFFIVIDSVLD